MSDIDEALLSAFAFLEAVPHPYAVLDADHVIRAVSAAYLDMTGTRRGDLIGRSISEAFPENPDDPSGAVDKLRASLESVLETGKPDELEVRHPIPVRGRPKVFKNRWWGIVNSAIRSDGRIVGVLHHGYDITGRVQAARHQEIRDKATHYLSRLAYWDFVPSKGEAYGSAGLAAIFGFPEVDGPIDAEAYLSRYIAGDAERQLTEFAALEDAPVGSTLEGEYQIELPDGRVRWIHMFGELERVNVQDPARFIGLAMDVTEARKRETKLSEAVAQRDDLLTQKDVLLSEVNHRIKNSLQIVSSILSLDARKTAGPEARKRLEKASGRVSAVAAIHELIYKSDQVATVELGGYLRDLCASLADSAQGSVICEADTLHVSTDKAISIALLVNELTSNAMEHGFKDRSDGEVRVSAKRQDGGLILIVQDDGIGKAAAASKGLGTRIVTSMVAQLDGEMEEGSVKNTARGGSNTGHRVLISVPLAE